MPNLSTDVFLSIYKANDWVFETIDSVISQSYEDWHLTIIDDASNDGMLDKIQQRYDYLSNKISYIALESNKRAVGARNYAIERTNRDVLAFIDQDDRWHTDKLMQQVKILSADDKINAVHTNIEIINGDGVLVLGDADGENEKRDNIDWNNLSCDELSRILFCGLHIRLVSAVVTRKAFKNLGGFDESTSGAEDWEFWFRLSAQYKISHIPSALISRRRHGSNTNVKYKLQILHGKLKTIGMLELKFPHISDLIKSKRKKFMLSAFRLSLEENKKKKAYSHAISLLKEEPWNIVTIGKLVKALLKHIF
jgi:glycosyltransferase involved in cell wall biosynthesis